MAATDGNQQHSQEERAHALDAYLDFGPAEASRRSGVPSGTIRSWAHRAGLTGPAHGRTAAATEAAQVAWASRRLALTDETGEAAAEVLARLRVARKSLDAQRFAAAFASLIEKAELLSGGATSRLEIPEDDLRERVQGLRDDIAARREAKAAAP